MRRRSSVAGSRAVSRELRQPSRWRRTAGCRARLCRAVRKIGHRRFRHGRSRRVQITQPHRDRVRTNFPRRTRFPTAAQIFHVDRALDSQARAVILRAFAHVTAQQRRLVFSLGDATALQQLPRRLHRLPSPCIKEKFLGNRNRAHGRPTSPIASVLRNCVRTFDHSPAPLSVPDNSPALQRWDNSALFSYRVPQCGTKENLYRPSRD